MSSDADRSARRDDAAPAALTTADLDIEALVMDLDLPPAGSAASFDASFDRTLVVPHMQTTLPRGPAAEDDDGDGAPHGMRQVGRYRIVERLGRGGMASVFRAHDPSIGRDVAIKFLHASLCEDAQCRDRFLHEARAAGVLSHPNIVVVHDVGEIDGRPYMAMELLAGEPLSRLMDEGQVPLRQALGIAMQIASALDYAHARHVVHRDIKPTNIVRLAGTDTVKVLDFGIAHVEFAGDADRTRAGDVLGTPQYMSPEQTCGEKLDGRTDLFSLGVVLYQMLSGQRPFTGDSLVALAWKIGRTEPPAIDSLRPDLPASVRRIVERLLRKQPDQRFQTGAELVDALQGVIAELDEAQKAIDAPRIVSLRVRWAAAMALLVAVVMGVCGTVVVQRQNAALMEQATASGAAQARFIAAQNAVAALSEDWPSVGVALQEMMKTGDFASIAVLDRQGVVRAASDPRKLDQPWKPHAGEPLAVKGDVSASRYISAAGEAVLGFEAPMTFAGKSVGRVELALAGNPLERVARLSIGLMVTLVIVTVLAVGIAMFALGNWFQRPMRRLSQAMDELARGHSHARIDEQRQDEFGLLYGRFNAMAQSLEDGREPARAEPGPPVGR